jgi:crotonobetainyl-CoA:carnitine CoA-transferase CaiB-like acyl-CoA transferase
VPCGIVGTYHQFFQNPQVDAMEMNPVIDHPTIGPIRLAGVPVRFEKTPGSIRHAPPTLGQHTDEILGEFGYDAEAIEALRRRGVVGSRK